MRKTSNRGGFTLAEILVTVTVIAVLSAVVVPAVTQYINKGDTPASQGDLSEVRSGVSGFVADIRQYPGDLRQLTTQITTSGTDSLHQSGAATPLTYSTTDAAAWKGPYFAGQLTTLVAPDTAGLFTSNGLKFTVGPKLGVHLGTVAITANWLATRITSAITCGVVMALDKGIDNSDGKAAGTIVWTEATDCSAAGNAVTAYLRITPAS